MADGLRGRRKPRIRKAAPTVRQKIESGAQLAEAKTHRRFQLFSVIAAPLRIVSRVLTPILRPLTPLGRLLLKILNWLVPRYFINAWRELKLVTWPNRRETWRLTGAVIVFSIVFGTLIWLVDLGLDQLFKRFVLR